MRDWLVAFIWRDPDPLWRWAAGQNRRKRSARPYWRLAALWFLTIVLMSLLLVAKMDPTWTPVDAILGAGAISASISLFVLVLYAIANSPGRLAAKGRTPTAHDLLLTRISPSEMARYYYWGYMREIVFYYAGHYVPMLLVAAILLPSIFSGTHVMYDTAVFLAFAIIAPLGLCFMAVASGMYFGMQYPSRGTATVSNVLLTFIAFPLFAFIIPFLFAGIHVGFQNEMPDSAIVSYEIFVIIGQFIFVFEMFLVAGFFYRRYKSLFYLDWVRQTADCGNV